MNLDNKSESELRTICRVFLGELDRLRDYRSELIKELNGIFRFEESEQEVRQEIVEQKFETNEALIRRLDGSLIVAQQKLLNCYRNKQ